MPRKNVQGSKPKSEAAFRRWYERWAQKLGLSPNPDALEHFYDYRAAFRAGATPDAEGHWPSRFKREGHPNLIIDGVDTRTGHPARDMRTPADVLPSMSRSARWEAEQRARSPRLMAAMDTAIALSEASKGQLAAQDPYLNLASLIPGIGAPVAAYQSIEAARRGRPGVAGAAALGAIPLGLGKVGKGAARGAKQLAGKRWAIITGTNPHNSSMPEEVNKALDDALGTLVRRRFKGKQVVRTVGSEGAGKPTDPGYLVMLDSDADEKVALNLSRQFGQAGAVTDRGLYDFHENVFFPSRGVVRPTKGGSYTQLLDESGKPMGSFALDLDFGAKGEPPVSLGAAPRAIRRFRGYLEPAQPLRQQALPEVLPATTAAPSAEAIATPSIRVGDQVFPGTDHGDALNAATEALGKEPEKWERGFTTTAGRFVDDQEAATLATWSGQVRGDIPEQAIEGGLHSSYLDFTPQMGNVARQRLMDFMTRNPNIGELDLPPETAAFLRRGGEVLPDYPGSAESIVRIRPAPALQLTTPEQSLRLPPGAPSVLGASSPEFAYVDPGTYHGTRATGFDVPTRSEDIGAHTGTREQAAARILNYPGLTKLTPAVRKTIKSVKGRVLRLAGVPQNPARLLDDPGSWLLIDDRGQSPMLTDLVNSNALSEKEAKQLFVKWAPKFETAYEGTGDLDALRSGALADLKGVLSKKGHDAIVYPNAFEAPGESIAWFDPKRSLQPWSKAVATRGLTIPLDEQRTLALAGAHLLRPKMTSEEWLDEVSRAFPAYATALRSSPELGEAVFKVAKRYDKLAGSLKPYEEIAKIAEKADPLYREWYRGWAPAMSRYFPGEPGEMLTRFSLLSAQKSPKEETRQALKALQYLQTTPNVTPAKLQQAVGTTASRASALLAAWQGRQHIKGGLKTSGYELAKRGHGQTGALDRHVIRAYTGRDELNPAEYEVLQSRVAADAERAGMNFDEFQAMVWGGQSGYSPGFAEPGASAQDWLAHWLAQPEFRSVMELFPESAGLMERGAILGEGAATQKEFDFGPF